MKRKNLWTVLGICGLFLGLAFLMQIAQRWSVEKDKTTDFSSAITSSALSSVHSSSVQKSVSVTFSETHETSGSMRLFLEIPDEVKRQSEVVVPIMIQNNPGVLGAQIKITYDEMAMELLDAEAGNVFENVLTLTLPATFYSGCSFLWDGVSIENQDVKDGEILRLKFRLLKSGKHPLSVRYEPGNIVDAKLAELSPEIENQFILVK